MPGAVLHGQDWHAFISGQTQQQQQQQQMMMMMMMIKKQGNKHQHQHQTIQSFQQPPTASNSAGSCQHHTTSSTHHKLSVCSTVNPVLHEYVNADSVLLQSNKLLSPVQPLSSE
jgi:hypothetical protein